MPISNTQSASRSIKNNLENKDNKKSYNTFKRNKLKILNKSDVPIHFSEKMYAYYSKSISFELF